MQAVNMPSSVRTDNVRILGVGINSDGELLRYEIKSEKLNSIQDNFSIKENRDFLKSLERNDFDLITEIDSSALTPLDAGLEAGGYLIYVLLPKSWTYSQTPISMKSKDAPRQWKHAPVQVNHPAITPKVAALYLENSNDAERKDSCWYEFNLNVSIQQSMNGHKMRTDIIIDPGTRGNNRP